MATTLPSHSYSTPQRALCFPPHVQQTPLFSLLASVIQLAAHGESSNLLSTAIGYALWLMQLVCLVKIKRGGTIVQAQGSTGASLSRPREDRITH